MSGIREPGSGGSTEDRLDRLERHLRQLEDAVDNDRDIRDRVEELEEEVENLTQGVQNALELADEAVRRCERIGEDVGDLKDALAEFDRPDGEEKDGIGPEELM